MADEDATARACREAGAALRDGLGLDVTWVIALRSPEGQIITVSSVKPADVASFLEDVLLLAVAAQDAGGVVH